MKAVLVALALAVAPGVADSADGAGRAATCRAAALRVTIGAPVSEKTMQHTLPVVLTSRAAGPCVLVGYPAVRLLDRRGRPLPFRYVHGGDQMITRATPRRVVLAAGASAYFALDKNACVSRTNRGARTLLVSLPGARERTGVELPRRPSMDYCRNDPGATVTVSPFVSTLDGWRCRSQGTCAANR